MTIASFTGGVVYASQRARRTCQIGVEMVTTAGTDGGAAGGVAGGAAGVGGGAIGGSETAADLARPEPLAS